ncbi:MAG: asparagine synthase (glutamine-hydrolyzing) [Acidobacteriia bacterium]|nr:asparagine synthase (glutamine-hydrolyzing) [Terriglobia bacterium]
MCGIVGCYQFDQQKRADPALLLKMCDRLRHRGPDDQGQYAWQNAGLGARRLSIIGVETGHQPIPNEDKSLWVVQNGEIYNYLEIKDELIKKGHKFTTTSDTECIVHLYEEFGEDCVSHLRGMFAFAILNQRDNSLFIARDRLGIKPLFYSVQGNRMLFASEMKALLEDETLSREIDFSALDAYFTYAYIPSPLTIFKGIRKLDAGHSIRCDSSGVKIEKYWDFEFRPDLKKSEADFTHEFIHLFDETVKSHLMSEVPLGVFLSGGVDSGMVVASMARSSDAPVRAFTMGFGGRIGGYLDERAYAKQVAGRYGVEYHEFEVQPHLEEIIDFIVESFDEPFADDSVIPTYYICKLARQHVTVALTGLGGDELFGGYERYLGLALSNHYQRIPSMLRRGIVQPIVGMLPEQPSGHYRINHLKRFVRSADRNPADRYGGYLSVLDEKGRGEFYSEEVLKQLRPAETEGLATQYFTSLNARDLLDRAMYQDLKMYLPDDILALSDRLSMHHSLELRVPFVDHKLVEFCVTIPSGMKVRGLKKKYLLKKMAREFLPPEVINHRKQGFASPMASWLKSDLKEYAEELLSHDNLRKHGLFKPDFAKKVLHEHFGGRELNDKLIFSLMIFQKWYERYCQN